MRRCRLSAVLFAALLPATAGAFELPQPGETVCYGRAYADSHLAQHPGQVARTLVLELIDWKDYEGLGFFLNVVLADDPWHTWGAGGACYDTEEGTLCAIDTEPRDVKDARVVAMLEMFADVIGRSLETEERLEAQEHNLAHEKELARLQDELVAVLGHDLRNPVAAFSAGIRQLEREPLNDKARMILPLMRSSLFRMNDLISNIMLHARARLGGGIRVTATPDAPLAEAVRQVVEEIRAAEPESTIDLDLTFTRPVACDAPRVAQAVSNLLSNAVRHGTPGSPVEVRGATDDNEVSITVSNRGLAVPGDLRDKLFHPFQRGTHAQGEGLGLGLYIAATIAEAHNGRIGVTCEGGTTTFAFTLPLTEAAA